MAGMRGALVLTSLIVCSSGPVTADWPQRRHDAAHTGFTEESVTPPLERKWTYDVPGRLCRHLDADALLAAGDSLFLDAPHVEFSRIDARTGEVIWRTEERQFVVAVAGEVIMEAFEWPPPPGPTLRRGINAYEVSTGEVRWSATTDDVLHNPDLGTGPSAWLHNCLAGPARCTVRNGTVCLCDIRPGPHDRREPRLVWLDARDGTLVRESRLVPERPEAAGDKEPAFSPYAQPFHVYAWGRDLVLLLHSEPCAKPQPIHGPWAVSGDEPLGTTPEEPFSPQMASLETPRIALAEQAGVALHYAGGHTGERVLICRNARTGEAVWSQQLVVPSNYYTPAVDEKSAYVGMYDGTVYALDLLTGETRWRTAVGKPFPEESGLLPSIGQRGLSWQAPVCSVAGDTVWVFYWRKMLALDAATGEIQWQTEGVFPTGYEPVIHDGWVYILTGSGIDAWGPAAGTGDRGERDAEVPAQSG
jgi:hypothetical protein